MNDNRLKSPRHDTSRTVLRVVGPSAALVGLVFTIVGISSFFSALNDFGPPRYFWCAFVGIPLIGVGMMISQLGYMGAIYRYIAAESTPVARDTFNDLGEGIRPGVKAVAQAVTEGIEEARNVSRQKPERPNPENPVDTNVHQ
jgi:hypothetical protein